MQPTARILSTVSRAIRTPAIISAALVLPLVILELVNRRSFDEGFPFALFVVLWLLPLGFILILRPMLHRPRPADRAPANAYTLLLRVALLALITWLWVVIILDQTPCFLGVPNCD